MTYISISDEVVISDPQIKEIADEVFKTLQLSMDKAVVHHFEPNAYPIVDNDSFEQLFLDTFKGLHETKQQAARIRVMHRIKSEPWRKAYYRNLAAVDLTSNIPVENQVSQLSKVRSISADNLVGYYRSANETRLMSSNIDFLSTAFVNPPSSIFIRPKVAHIITDIRLTTPKGRLKRPPTPIEEKYKALGGEKGFLGPPVSEESWTYDYQGKYRHYKYGSIYWHPKYGAYEVHGAIREFWKKYGWERSFLGYPMSDEMDAPHGKGRYSKFEGGIVMWHPKSGTYIGTLNLVNKLSLRIIRLHCFNETDGAFGIEAGSDEMAIGGAIIDTYGNVHKINKTDLGSYDDGDWSKWTNKVLYTLGVNQDDEIWPKTFIATLSLVEVDSGGYTGFLNKLVDKLVPYVKNKLKEELIAGGAEIGGAIGAALGYIAGEIAAYVVGKIFNEIKSWWNDDIFTPSTFTVQIPGPGALFPGGTYDSLDSWRHPEGHGGKYEYWADWVIHG